MNKDIFKQICRTIFWIFLLTSCSGSETPWSADGTLPEPPEPEPVEETLSVSTESISFPASGELQKTIRITSNTSWTIINKSLWMECSQTEGEGDATISITANGNTTNSERTGVITISYGTTGKTVTISVIQEAVEYKPVSIDVNPNSLAFEAEGTSKNITVTIKNADYWKSDTPKDKDGKVINWLKVTEGNNSATIKVEDNNGLTRTAYIVFYAIDNNGKLIQDQEGKNIADTLTVTQNEAWISITGDDLKDDNELVFDAEGGYKNIIVSSNVSWTASTTEDWVDLDPKNGIADNNQTVEIEVEANTNVEERAATIAFKYWELYTCWQ